MPSTLQDELSWYPPMIIHPLNNMTYSLVKRKKASQLAVMLATPSHAIESVTNPDKKLRVGKNIAWGPCMAARVIKSHSPRQNFTE